MLMNNIQIYKWMNFAWFYLFIYLFIKYVFNAQYLYEKLWNL
jgi:hypothetical protein